MTWLAKLLGRDPVERERTGKKLDALEARTEIQVARVERLLNERDRLAVAVRNTATALRAEGRR